MTNINTFSYNSKNLFGYTGYSQSLKAIVILFRGTQTKSLSNLITDISLYQSDFPKCVKCKVHTGFYDGINLLAASFIPALQKVAKAYPGAPIYIGGHSLGGALAVLAAPIIQDTFPDNKVAQIITGGQPRVGNKQFAIWYNGLFESYRVVFNKDLVPHFPNSGPLSILAHQQATHLSLRHHLSVNQAHEQLLTAVYYHQGK